MIITMYTDGGARGNPGPAGTGMVLLDADGKTLWEMGEYIGETTNNQAEYRALITALKKAKELGATEVSCFLDSELLVKQLKQEYRVRNAALAPLFVAAWNLARGFSAARFTHIPREKNKRADALVNAAIDKRA